MARDHVDHIIYDFWCGRSRTLTAGGNHALHNLTDIGFMDQANAYCEQVKNAPDGWQICLQLFMKQPKA